MEASTHKRFLKISLERQSHSHTNKNMLIGPPDAHISGISDAVAKVTKTLVSNRGFFYCLRITKVYITHVSDVLVIHPSCYTASVTVILNPYRQSAYSSRIHFSTRW